MVLCGFRYPLLIKGLFDLNKIFGFPIIVLFLKNIFFFFYFFFFLGQGDCITSCIIRSGLCSEVCGFFQSYIQCLQGCCSQGSDSASTLESQCNGEFNFITAQCGNIDCGIDCTFVSCETSDSPDSSGVPSWLIGVLVAVGFFGVILGCGFWLRTQRKKNGYTSIKK